MGNAVEVAAQIGVYDFGASAPQSAADGVHRLVGVAPGPVGVAVGMAVGFSDQQEQQRHGSLHDTVLDRADV